MRYRKLRIVWSVFWGLACVLLIVLWVRSYWVVNCIVMPDGKFFAFGRGEIMIETPLYTTRNDEWKFESYPAENLGISKWKFGLQRYTGDSSADALDVFYIPDALAFFLVGMLGVSPWIRWRFRLRTLLIATTLLAVVLGLAVWLSR